MRSETSVTGTLLLEGAAGVRTVELAACLDPAAAERATCDATAWIKALRQLPVDGVPLRDRFIDRGDSTWWFIEAFLARERIVLSAFKALAALEALLDQASPRGLTIARGDRVVRTVADALARRRGLPCRGLDTLAPDERLRRRDASLRHLAETVLPRLRAPAAAPATDCDLAVFVHAGFWRADPAGGGRDAYLGRVLDALGPRLPPDRLRLVGIGPRILPKARGRRSAAAARPPALPFPSVAQYASLRTVAPSLRIWRQRRALRRAVLGSAALRQAAIIRGADLWPVLGGELGDALGLQAPWAARARDEIGAALDALRPRAALTYAEAGNWGRALVLEGRRRGIPVIGVQHGFIDRHLLLYRHEPDEMAPSPGNPADQGYPRPDLTLLFDACAAAHLRDAGAFPAASIQVTGSPQLDDLAARIARLAPADLEAARTAAGAGGGQPLVLVVTKFVEIRPVLAALVDAIRQLPSVRAVVKCHPVEAPGPYRDAAAGVPNLTVLPADADLAPLLRLARLVVTVHSTVAFDAMALGVPALTLALPNNLSPFVEAGAMAGLAAGAPIAPVLRALLDDDARRAALAARADAFLTRYRIRPDGQAAQRSADAILTVLRR